MRSYLTLILAIGGLLGLPVSGVTAQTADAPPSATVSEAVPTGDPAKDLASARVAETAGRHDEAIRLLTKILEDPKGQVKREARELLGLARERNGQLAQAEAEYRQYLSDYPAGTDAERVRQRLDAVMALQDKPLEDQQAAEAAEARHSEEAAFHRLKPRPIRGGIGLKPMKKGVQALPDDPLEHEGWQTRVDGGIGVTYRRGTDWTATFDPFDPGKGKTSRSALRDHEISADADLEATCARNGFQCTAMLSIDRDRDLTGDEFDTTSIGQFYLDGYWIDEALRVRLGRQTRYSGGVLGRFDGGLVSYGLGGERAINLVAGSPVQRMRDGFNPDDKYFYGASYDFNVWGPGWSQSAFVIEQQASGVLDRRAVGLDVTYEGAARSAFASVDYDITFDRLNTAIVSGTRSFADKSKLSVRADYRKSPTLFASNALQGQGLSRLDELLGRYDYNRIYEYAADRSADTYSAMVSYSLPLTRHLELYTDLYESYMTGTPASAGIEAMPAEGLDTYATAQLIATGLARENDLYVAGLRYGRNHTYDQYELELGAKLPLTDRVRISPAGRIGYRHSDPKRQDELHLEPSIGLNLALDRQSSFEIDAGAHLTERFLDVGTERESELLLTLGYRYDLYSQ